VFFLHEYIQVILIGISDLYFFFWFGNLICHSFMPFIKSLNHLGFNYQLYIRLNCPKVHAVYIFYTNNFNSQKLKWLYSPRMNHIQSKSKSKSKSKRWQHKKKASKPKRSLWTQKDGFTACRIRRCRDWSRLARC